MGESLDPGSTAALAGLAASALAVGLGALFFRSKPPEATRAREATAIFELFVAVAIFTGASATVCISFILLHENRAIDDADFSIAAMPLAASVVVLVFLRAISLLPASPRRALAVAPVAVAAVCLASLIGSRLWVLSVPWIAFAAMTIILIGAVLSLVAKLVLRRIVEPTVEAERTERLWAALRGYMHSRCWLAVSLPVVDGVPPQLSMTCWTKDGRVFVGEVELSRLAGKLSEAYRKLATGEATSPVGARALARLELKPQIPLFRQQGYVAIQVDCPGADPAEAMVPAKVFENGDGLFEVGHLSLLLLPDDASWSLPAFTVAESATSML